MRLNPLKIILALLFLAGPAAAEDRITSLHATINIQPDTSMQVSEQIAFISEDGLLQQGFSRKIATDAPDAAHRLAVTTYQVACDGIPLTQGRDPDIDINTGVVTIPFHPDGNGWANGSHVCELQYIIAGETSGQHVSPFVFFEDYDEISWNASGTWNVPVGRASVSVLLPATAKILYAQDAAGLADPTQENNHALHFNVANGLQPGQTLDIIIMLDKGAVHDSATTPVPDSVRPQDDTPMPDMLPPQPAHSTNGILKVLEPFGLRLSGIPGFIILGCLFLTSLCFSLLLAVMLMLSTKILLHEEAPYGRCIITAFVLILVFWFSLFAAGLPILSMEQPVPMWPGQLLADYLLSTLAVSALVNRMGLKSGAMVAALTLGGAGVFFLALGRLFVL